MKFIFILNNKKYFFVCSLIIFIVHQIIFQNYLIFENNHVAEDYKGYIPNMILGKIWFLKNGFFSIPHFIPSLCGGIPFHAAPTSAFISFMQIIFINFSIPSAIKITFFIFSLVGFLGMYFLCKKSFKLGYFASLVGATLFIYNGFFINRVLVGHLIYGYTAFIPLYSLLIILSIKNNNYLSKIYILLSSLILSSFFYAGSSSFMLFVLYSLVIIFILYCYLCKIEFIKVFKKFIYSLILTLMLSISKIGYTLSFVKNFPREINGATLDNYFSFFYTFLTSLFIIPDPFFFDKHQHQIDKMYVYLHELEYGLSVIPLLIILYFVFFVKKNIFIINKNLLFFLIIILLMPTLMIVEVPYLTDAINNIPIISSTWVRARWLCVYIVPLILFSCFIIEKIKFKNNFVLLLILLMPILQNIIYIEAKSYFFPEKSFKNKAVYSLESINNFSNKLNYKNINEVRIEYVKNDQNFTRMGLNEGFIINTSELFCYNPVFGYLLKSLPRYKIIDKDEKYLEKVIVNKKKYNLFKPMCFLFPDKNGCKIGDLYSGHEKDELEKFVNYKPIDFKTPVKQKIFDYVSLLTLFYVLISIIKYLIKLRRNSILN